MSGSLPPGASPAWYAELLATAPANTQVVVDTKREALAHQQRRAALIHARV